MVMVIVECPISSCTVRISTPAITARDAFGHSARLLTVSAQNFFLLSRGGYIGREVFLHRMSFPSPRSHASDLRPAHFIATSHVTEWVRRGQQTTRIIAAICQLDRHSVGTFARNKEESEDPETTGAISKSSSRKLASIWKSVKGLIELR